MTTKKYTTAKPKNVKNNPKETQATSVTGVQGIFVGFLKAFLLVL
jgi:tetrahydromethanopterin S-methyltransferase subunit F